MQDLVTKPSRNSSDVEAWSSHHQGRSIDGFGAKASRLDTSRMYFEDKFDPDHSKVVMVDHSAPSQMHPSLKKRLIDDGCTDIYRGGYHLSSYIGGEHLYQSTIVDGCTSVG